MPPALLDDLSKKESELLKLILCGNSIIDWHTPFCSTDEEAAALLRVNEFDLGRQKDLDRLLAIHNEATGYLQRELGFHLAPEIIDSFDMIRLLRIASDDPNIHLRQEACSVLKAMNIINHIDGRELLYNCPISLRDLFSLVEDKIERTLSGLSRSDPLLLRYKGGRKPKDSLITKLLCKRETIAAQIYDRVRYRIVTRTHQDIVRVILHLFNTILPFNYIIPDASVNQLLSLSQRARLQTVVESMKRRFLSPTHRMEYSGYNYRVCKFVVDIPVRMDRFLAAAGSHLYRDSLGSLAYVLVEFQIVDEETDAENDTGKSSHENYKNRQKRGVIKRLKGRKL